MDDGFLRHSHVEVLPQAWLFLTLLTGSDFVFYILAHCFQVNFQSIFYYISGKISRAGDQPDTGIRNRTFSDAGYPIHALFIGSCT
jgi:hypothetical protein